MDILVKVPDYDSYSGLRMEWMADPAIDVAINDGEVVISANTDGLRSLASHLLTLSQATVPSGRHIHYSAGSGLDEGSVDLILCKA